MFMLRLARQLRWLPPPLADQLLTQMCSQSRTGNLRPQLTSLAELCLSIEKADSTSLQLKADQNEIFKDKNLSSKEREDWAAFFDAEIESHANLKNAEWQNIRGLLLHDVAQLGHFDDDSLDCRIEVKQGAGGQEAHSWSIQLFEAYRVFCQIQGFQYEDTASPNSDELTAKIVSPSKASGAVGPFGSLKFEHGIHRMQRTAKDRAHTVAASVAILPIRDTGNIELKTTDLHVIVQRSCAGPGGQGLAAATQAIRMKHLPTGIEVYCTESRSHIDNRRTALQLIKEKLAQLKADEKAAELSMNKKSALGSGVWAEKIRSYNDHRDEIIDVRLGGCKFTDIASVLTEGNFGPILGKLREREENETITSYLTCSILSK